MKRRPGPDGTLAPERVLAEAKRPVQLIETAWLQERPVYRLTHKAAIWLVIVALAADRLMRRRVRSLRRVGCT